MTTVTVEHKGQTFRFVLKDEGFGIREDRHWVPFVEYPDDQNEIMLPGPGLITLTGTLADTTEERPCPDPTTDTRPSTPLPTAG